MSLSVKRRGITRNRNRSRSGLQPVVQIQRVLFDPEILFFDIDVALRARVQQPPHIPHRDVAGDRIDDVEWRRRTAKRAEVRRQRAEHLRRMRPICFGDVGSSTTEVAPHSGSSGARQRRAARIGADDVGQRVCRIPTLHDVAVDIPDRLPFDLALHVVPR